MGVTAIAQSQSVTGRNREVIGVPLAYRNRHPGTASSAGHVESVGLVVDVVFRDVDEVDVALREAWIDDVLDDLRRAGRPTRNWNPNAPFIPYKEIQGSARPTKGVGIRRMRLRRIGWARCT